LRKEKPRQYHGKKNRQNQSNRENIQAAHTPLFLVRLHGFQLPPGPFKLNNDHILEEKHGQQQL
jgi:hypothetical protein